MFLAVGNDLFLLAPWMQLRVGARDALVLVDN